MKSNPDQLKGKIPKVLTPTKYPAGEMSGEADYDDGLSDVAIAHAAIVREQPEPGISGAAKQSARLAAFPIWFLIFNALVIFWAGGYLLLFSGGFRSDIFNERVGTASLFFPAEGGVEPGAAEAAAEDPVKLGEAFFKLNCATCHQPSGQGASGQFPPLAKSEWVNGSEKRLAGILLFGLKGPITVHGQKGTYSGLMQAWGPLLSDKQIAYILTYVRQAWGNSAPPIAPEQIAAAREEFSSRSDQWTEEELLKIPEDATLPGGAE